MKTPSKVTFTVVLDDREIVTKQAKTMYGLLYRHSFDVIPARQCTYTVTVRNVKTDVTVLTDVESNINVYEMLRPLIWAKKIVES